MIVTLVLNEREESIQRKNERIDYVVRLMILHFFGHEESIVIDWCNRYKCIEEKNKRTKDIMRIQTQDSLFGSLLCPL